MAAFSSSTSNSVFTSLLTVLVTAACAESRQTTVTAVADSIAADLLTPPPPVSGVAIAASRDGGLVLDRAWGFSDPVADRPLEPSQPQRIGSLTKQFTAAAVLGLVERGIVRLDAPIQEYLPGFDTQGHPVTVRNLLNHTSGLPSYSALYAGSGAAPVPRARVLDTLQSHPFDFDPGEAYRYSNSGYYLLGVILEEVTDESYARHLEESLFEPLGLGATGYCGYGDEDVPVGYRAAGDSLEAVVLVDREDYLGGSGGLCSTAADLVTWQRALAAGRVVTPDTYALMTTPTVLATGDTVPYGMGVDIDVLEGHEILAHGGAVAGFNSRMAYYPDVGLSLAVLVNTNTPRTEAVEEAVARAALDLERLVPTDLPLTAEERARYVGSYDLGPIRIRVFEDGERLLVQPSGQTAARLLYQGDDVFLANVGAEVRFEFRVADGRATAVILYQGGQQLEGRRVEDREGSGPSREGGP